jgi:methylphosphotriester-DNA--protein-cysteine methyltransferase
MHRLACHLRRGDGACINLDEAKLLESRAIEAGYRDCRRCEIGYLRIRREHELAGKLKP